MYRYTYIIIYIYYIYSYIITDTWNLFVYLFWGCQPSKKKAFSNQNIGSSGAVNTDETKAFEHELREFLPRYKRLVSQITRDA